MGANSAVSSKWKKLKLYLRPRKMTASTESSENKLTVIPEPIRTKIEGLRGQSLRELSKDYFEVNYSNLQLLDDLNDYLDLIISILNSIKEHDEVSDINLPVKNISEFMKARDPFAALVEMLPLFSEQRMKTREIIQVLKEKMDSKAKRFKFWKTVTRVVSWSVLLLALGVVLFLSIIVHPMASIAAVSATIVRPLQEEMLSFFNNREAKLKEMIKVVYAIEEASVLEHPPVIGSIENFASEEIAELKQVLDQLIQDKDVKAAKKRVEGFQKRVVEIKEEAEKWRRFIKQAAREVDSSLK